MEFIYISAIASLSIGVLAAPLGMLIASVVALVL